MATKGPTMDVELLFHEVRYRDREGYPISRDAWGALWADLKYKVVAETAIEGSQIVVRTVWEGIATFPGRMFSTGVSGDGGVTFRDVDPSDGPGPQTEAQALVEHEAVVRHRTP